MATGQVRGLRRTVAVAVLGWIGLGSAASAAAQELLVFAAASLKDALDAAVAAYPGDAEIAATYASSSTLARQIEQGAPADVFISANPEWMDYLAERGLIRAGTRADLLGNGLVLVAPVGERADARDRARLRSRRRARRRPPGDGRPGSRPGRDLRQGGAADARRLALGRGPGRPRRQRARRARAGRPRRGAARHRLPLRRDGRRCERPGRRRLPARQPPADHLSGRRHGRQQAPGRGRVWSTSSSRRAPRRPSSASASAVLE